MSSSSLRECASYLCQMRQQLSLNGVLDSLPASDGHTGHMDSQLIQLSSQMSSCCMHHVQASSKFARLPLGLVPVSFQELESILEAADARAGVQSITQQPLKWAGNHDKVQSCCSSSSSATLHKQLLCFMPNSTAHLA